MTRNENLLKELRDITELKEILKNGLDILNTSSNGDFNKILENLNDITNKFDYLGETLDYISAKEKNKIYKIKEKIEIAEINKILKTEIKNK